MGERELREKWWFICSENLEPTGQQHKGIITIIIIGKITNE